MPQAKHVGVVLGGIAALLTFLTLMLYLWHEKDHDHTDYTMRILIVTMVILSIGAAIFAVCRNLADATRADSAGLKLLNATDQHQREMEQCQKQVDHFRQASRDVQTVFEEKLAEAKRERKQETDGHLKTIQIRDARIAELEERIATLEPKQFTDDLLRITARATRYIDESRNVAALAELLERIRSEWDNQGFKLIHPLSVATMPDDITEHRHKRLWEFRLFVRQHLEFMESQKIESVLKFPSDAQFFDVHKSLIRESENLNKCYQGAILIMCGDAREVL